MERVSVSHHLQRFAIYYVNELFINLTDANSPLAWQWKVAFEIFGHIVCKKYANRYVLQLQVLLRERATPLMNRNLHCNYRGKDLRATVPTFEERPLVVVDIIVKDRTSFYHWDGRYKRYNLDASAMDNITSSTLYSSETLYCRDTPCANKHPGCTQFGSTQWMPPRISGNNTQMYVLSPGSLL